MNRGPNDRDVTHEEVSICWRRARGGALLRHALIVSSNGLWLDDPAAKECAARLPARGKRGGAIGCVMAHRANRIASALVRDGQTLVIANVRLSP